MQKISDNVKNQKQKSFYMMKIKLKSIIMRHINVRMKLIAVILFVLVGLVLSSAQVAAQSDWTFMVYLDGDNNLEASGMLLGELKG